MAVTPGARLTTTTQDFLAPKAVDTILNSNVAATRFLNAAKRFRGETMKFPVIVDATNRGGSFYGYDTLNTNAIDTRVNLSFNASFIYEPVSVALTELALNKNAEEQVIDLAAISMQEAANRLADEVGDQFWSDGTGNSSKDILGLAAAIDDGGAVATYGGQSRSTYTGLQGTDTAAATLTLSAMATLWNAVSSGTHKPTVIYTTEAVFSLYESLLQPQERIMKDASTTKGLKGGTGFVGLSYKGVPVLADEKCTSGVMAFVNEDFIDFYALPVPMMEPIKYKNQVEGNDYDAPVGLGFSFSGWIKPTNQLALIGHIVLGGQLICRNPKRQGKLTGVTSV